MTLLIYIENVIIIIVIPYIMNVFVLLINIADFVKKIILF